MSFGAGLALQSSFPQQTFPRDNWMYNQRKKAAKDKAAAADDTDYNKYLNSAYAEIGKGKIHPLYAQDANEATAEFISQAAAARERAKATGENWRAAIEPARARFYSKSQQLHALSQGEYSNNENAYRALQSGAGTPELEQYLSISRGGDKAAMQKFQDKYGFVGVSQTPENNYPAVALNPYNKTDWEKVFTDEFSKPQFMQWDSAVKANYGKLPKSAQVYLSTYKIPRTQAEADVIGKQMGFNDSPPSMQGIIEHYVNNPVHFRSAEQQVRDKIEGQFGDEYFKLSMPDKKKIVANLTLEKAAPFQGYKITEKTFTPFAPKSPSSKSTQENFDVTVNYNADRDGNEVYSPSYKGSPEPKTYAIPDTDANGNIIEENGNEKIAHVVGVADKVEFVNGEMIIYVKDSEGNTYKTNPSASNLTQIRAQWGMSPYDVRNAANKKAGHKEYTRIHSGTTGVVYGNIYKGKPQKSEGVTTQEDNDPLGIF